MGQARSCIKWNDNVILSRRANNKQFATLNQIDITFAEADGQLFKIISPDASQRDCVYSDDKFYLGVEVDNQIHVLKNNEDYLTFANEEYGSLQSFRHIQRSRTINWGEHVTITSGDISLLVSNDAVPSFKWKNMTDLYRQRLVTYRLLNEELLMSDSCIKWHDQVSIQLSDDDLVAFIDTDTSIKFQKRTDGWTVFTIVPAGQIHGEGCVHFDENIHLQLLNKYVQVELSSDNIISNSLPSDLQLRSITTNTAPISVNSRKALCK
eukprot:Awhi_evm2s2491